MLSVDQSQKRNRFGGWLSVACTKIAYLPTLYNIQMLKRPLGDPRVAICALLLSLCSALACKAWRQRSLPAAFL